MDTVRIVSPIDGSLVAERPCAADAELDAALGRARAAQAAWAAVPVAERVAFCLAMLDAMLAEKDALTAELARMMGRPVRHGGEMGGFASAPGTWRPSHPRRWRAGGRAARQPAADRARATGHRVTVAP